MAKFAEIEASSSRLYDAHVAAMQGLAIMLYTEGDTAVRERILALLPSDVREPVQLSIKRFRELENKKQLS